MDKKPVIEEKAAESVIVWHDLRKNPKDLPPLSGEMYAERRPIFAVTKELGLTTAIRRKRGRTTEWYCCSYDGNTIFFDKEILMWGEIPIFQGCGE